MEILNFYIEFFMLCAVLNNHSGDVPYARERRIERDGKKQGLCTFDSKTETSVTAGFFLVCIVAKEIVVERIQTYTIHNMCPAHMFLGRSYCINARTAFST